MSKILKLYPELSGENEEVPLRSSNKEEADLEGTVLCHDCEGSGTYNDDQCNMCQGTGRVTE